MRKLKTTLFAGIILFVFFNGKPKYKPYMPKTFIQISEKNIGKQK